MRLKQLIRSIGVYKTFSDLEDFQVRGISCNSRNVQNNFVFVAISGNKDDGHKFIEDAISKGAKAIFFQASCLRPQDREGVHFIEVVDSRKTLARLATEFYGKPSSKMKVIGITGTNGKTTISYLIEAVLKEADKNPAVIGTINYRFKNKIISSGNTTPGPIELQSMLLDMLKADVDYVVMEVSSHALDQNRIEGINFESAIFTNLTQDHLDYHNTIEEYFQAKSKLFRNMKLDTFIVVNNDDSYGLRIKKLTKARVITYGIENKSDVWARDIKFDISRTEFKLITPKAELKIRSCLIGWHNVYNILAVIAWGLKEGIDLAVLISAIDKFHLVPGRLERINSTKGYFVFVDYAHTEDALQNVIKALRQLSKNKIIVVFGCGGDRDKTKRPKMGKVVTELADYAVITNDNPRFEDADKIINDIKKGIRKDNYCIIQERLEAIKKSLSMANTGDIILVAGKGHENYQILKDKVTHFDDREAVRECLKSMKY